MFRNFSPELPVLDALLRGPQYRLMNFAEAEALTRIFPYLVRLVLPKGAIDLARKMPVSDTALVATTNVSARAQGRSPGDSLIFCRKRPCRHTARRDFFERSANFPPRPTLNIRFPKEPAISTEMVLRPLNRDPPFWMTNYAQRFLLAVLVAVIAIVVPVFNYGPKLFLWLIRDRVRRLYRRLRMVDKALLLETDPARVQTLHAELENIARAANIVPMHSSDLFFELRAHIDRTRRHLASVDAQNGAAKVA